MALVAIPFLAFAAAFVLAGLSQTFNAQHGQSAGGFSNFLSSLIQDSPVASLLNLGAKASRYVISRFAASRFRELTSYLHSMARLWRAEFRAMRAQAEATTGVAQALERAIPIEAKRAAAPGLRLGKLNAKQLARFRSEVRPAIKRLTVAVDVTLPQQLGRIRARERVVENDVAKLRQRTGLIENGAIRVWNWLRDHPYGAAMGAFTGVLSIALSRIGLGGLECNNNPLKNQNCSSPVWSQFGRALGLAAFLTAAFDFAEFVKAAELVAEGIGTAVGEIEGVFALELPPLPAPGY